MQTSPLAGLALAIACPLLGAAETTPAPAITQVEIGRFGEFRVNGKPFLPIMSWLQSTPTYPRLHELGFNVFVGNWQNKPAAEDMAALALAAGGYAIPQYNGTGAGNPGVFAWIHGDEPDLTHRVQTGKVTLAAGLRANKSAPIESVLDGKTVNGGVLDPLEGATFTIDNEKAVTVTSLAVWVGIEKAGSTSTPSEMLFLGDGVELLRTAVEAKKGQQKWPLPAPATFQKLEVRITKTTPGKAVWGVISEIEAFDAGGVNLLKREPVGQMNQAPDVTLAEYRKMKAADPSRPVFLTLTASFMPRYEMNLKIPAEKMRPLYPRWAAATDALGVDIYPIAGWNKPEWLLDNIEGAKLLQKLAGPGKPVFAWIEAHNAPRKNWTALLPRHTRAEVWMNLIAGVKAIGYFTHCFQPFSEFCCDAPMQAELKRLNHQLTRLAPAILAEPLPGKATLAFADGIAGHLLLTRAEDGLYVFAQNLDLGGKAGKAVITVEGLKAGTRIEVVDEQRSIEAAEGRFEDAFEALAEHVYRLPR